MHKRLLAKPTYVLVETEELAGLDQINFPSKARFLPGSPLLLNLEERLAISWAFHLSVSGMEFNCSLAGLVLQKDLPLCQPCVDVKSIS